MERKTHDKKYYDTNTVKVKQAQKAYYENNKDKIKDIQKKYVTDNTDKVKEYQKQYREQNRLKNIEYQKQYREQNKEDIKEHKKLYMRERRKDPTYKIKSNLSANLYQALKKNGYTKNSQLFIALGCTYQEFKTYIESKFDNWMSWDNYGLYDGKCNTGWDIDHIIPTSTGTNKDSIYKLYHYTNLQPLCSKINRDIKKDFH